MSQGQIGYFIQQSLMNLAKEEAKNLDVVTVVTQVEVDRNDPSFESPTKPVGQFYTKEESEKIVKETGHIFIEDAGRGYRRVVPSPIPLNILEFEEIRALADANVVVIACGGGGIPVINNKEGYQGVDAVIDKDRAGGLLGDLLDAELYIVLTAVEQVSLDFGTDKEKALDSMTVPEAEKYISEGHFAEGSMKPKVEAVVEFIKKDKKRKALITHHNVFKEALEQKNGTWVTSE